MNNRVSLCMITKNEESCIVQAVQSVKHLISECIVVDTGSTDRTCEMATNEGAVVYSYPWHNNFSAARNFGIEKAGGEWILVLDADEIMSFVSCSDFMSLLNKEDIEGYYFPIYNLLGSGQQVASDHVLRLFRNKQCYRFEGPIHEQVTGAIQRLNSGGGIGYAEYPIYHYGYLDNALLAKDKNVRNCAVIMEGLKQQPDNAFLLYSLSMEYLQSGQVEKGEACLKKSLAHLSGKEGFFRHVVSVLANCLWTQHRYDELEEYLTQALTIMPLEPTLNYFAGLLCIVRTHYHKALQRLMMAVDGAGEVVSKPYLYVLIAEINNVLGAYPTAAKYYKKALELAARGLYPLLQLVGLRQRNENIVAWEEIAAIMNKALSGSAKEQLPSVGPGMKLLFWLLVVLHNQNESVSEVLSLCSCELEKISQQGCMPYICQLLKQDLKYIEVAMPMMPGCRSVTGLYDPGLPKVIKEMLQLVIQYLCPRFMPDPMRLLERKVGFEEGSYC